MTEDDALIDRLEQLAPGSLRSRAIDRLVLAHDASRFLMTPLGMVTVRDRGAERRRAFARPALCHGALGERVARAPPKRELGPDSASEAACTMGGPIANNSSRMSCDTESNLYNTIGSARVAGQCQGD